MSNSPEQSETVRQPYAAPKLVVYGSVGEITRNVGKTGAMDASPSLKTGA